MPFDDVAGEMVSDDAREVAAKGWFGYGRWDAPYWFVGMEPGGADDPAWYEAWLRLGGTELCDCRAHHFGAGFYRWHDERWPATQPTWRGLIQLLLSYERRSVEIDAVRAYQRDKWGSLDGDTALLEISGIRAQSTGVCVERDKYREHRISVLRERLGQTQPHFVVFYGNSYAHLYQKVIGARFEADGFCWTRKTLCVLVPHPVARSIHNGYWISKGQDIAERLRFSLRSLESFQPQEANLMALPTSRASQHSSLFEGDLAVADTSTLLPTDIIRVLVKHNPRRAGSKSLKRFECLQDGITVEDYELSVRQRLGESEARKCKYDLQWDFDRNNISIERNGRQIDLFVSPSMRRR